MTVAELIEELRQYDQNSEVLVPSGDPHFNWKDIEEVVGGEDTILDSMSDNRVGIDITYYMVGSPGGEEKRVVTIW